MTSKVFNRFFVVLVIVWVSLMLVTGACMAQSAPVAVTLVEAAPDSLEAVTAASKGYELYTAACPELGLPNLYYLPKKGQAARTQPLLLADGQPYLKDGKPVLVPSIAASMLRARVRLANEGGGQ